MRQLILFQTGNIEFALDHNCISHIRPIPEDSTGVSERVQQQPIEVDGRDLLLIDLAAASNEDGAASCPPEAEMIVVKESPLALYADQVKSTLHVNGERMDELPPVFGGTSRACFPKVLHLEDQLVLVINPDALADVETYAATLRAKSKAKRHHTEDEHKAPRTEKAPQIQTASETVARDTLETVVGEKLRNIIGRRVQQVVAQTMARALKQQLQ